jgi:hypothetical protein
LFGGAVMTFWLAYRRETAGLPWWDELDRRAVRHTLACLLARVAGRSPLEYLTADERARQVDAVLDMMQSPPVIWAGLAARFLKAV